MRGKSTRIRWTSKMNAVISHVKFIVKYNLVLKIIDTVVCLSSLGVLKLKLYNNWVNSDIFPCVNILFWSNGKQANLVNCYKFDLRDVSHNGDCIHVYTWALCYDVMVKKLVSQTLIIVMSCIITGDLFLWHSDRLS